MTKPTAPRTAPAALTTLWALVCVSILLASLPHAARAQTLFTTGDNSQFGVLDVTTGAYNPLGRTTYNGTRIPLFGLANAVNGNLYGLENTAAQTPRLFQVNRANGTLSLVAAVSGFSPNGNGLSALGSTSDGTLYAYFTSINGSNTNTTVYTINTSSAIATRVGTSGVGNTGVTFSGAINGDGGGGLFSTGSPADFSINRTTGAATKLQNDAGAGAVNALGFTNNNLYALNTQGGIFTINTANGLATNMNVTYDTNLAGVLYGAASITPFNTPEPGTLPLALMGLATSGLGMVCTLKRRKK